MLNQYAWHNQVSHSDYGQQAQEFIENALPAYKATGKDGFNKVYVIRALLKHLYEVEALEEHKEWMESYVRFFFGVNADPEFGESFVPELLAEHHRAILREKCDHTLPNFDLGLTMQEMLADVECDKTETIKWKDLMNAPYEIT